MANVPSVWPLIRNMRTYVSGRVDTRSGLALISAAGTDPIHSIKRLNNDIPSLVVQNSRIVGAGPRLYAQVSLAGALILVDTGYSGNPLSIFEMRPPNSPEAWTYIADSFKMSKMRADGTVFRMGIAPPLTAPTATFGPDALQIIDAFTAIGSWTNGGTAGVISQTQIVDAQYVSPPPIIYDTGSGIGEASIPVNGVGFPFPSLTAVAREGSILALFSFRLNPPGPAFNENCIVHAVLPGFTASVLSNQVVRQNGNVVTYVVHLSDVTLTETNAGFSPTMDNQPAGSTGTRAPASASSKGILLNTMIQITDVGSVNHYATVASISKGPDGSVAITFTLIWTGPVIALNFSTLVGLTTLRINTAQSENRIFQIVTNAFAFQVGAGTGFITETVNFDLSHVSTTDTPPIRRPVQDSDVISLAIQMDHPENLVEGKVLFDIDGATNDFTQNYFFKAFRQADLQQAVINNQTVLSSRQQNVNTSSIDGLGGRSLPPAQFKRVGPFVNAPQGGVLSGSVLLPLPEFGRGGKVPVSNQASTGAQQWTVLSFKVSDLTRVGADRGKTLANVAAVRFQFQVTAATNIKVSSFWIGGSYGPDIGDIGGPYFYRHRGRSTKTGAKSNPSPPMINGIEPHRQAVIISVPIHPDAQVDILDVFRWGGTLTNWIYVGSTPNSGLLQVRDVFQDLDIATAEQLEFDNFQPFPTLDTPKAGFVNVVGNQVTWLSGDQFNQNWAQGTIININGTDFTVYSQPSSTTQVQIVENAGTLNNVPYFIKEATILGQPLPAMWGPFSQNSALFNFACGDQYQPGVLFLTKGNNADSAPDVLQIEITSPSEPLMNGCIYNGQPFVWSSARFFILYPIAQGGFLLQGGEVIPVSGTNIFTPQDIAGAKGLFARWFFCAGPGIPRIWYGAEDGIYETVGSSPVSITDEMLYLLFPHDGQPGQPVLLGSETVFPPDFTQTTKLRLSYCDGFLYFDYVDTNGLPTTLVYSALAKVWSIDVYNLGTGKGVLTHYLEEGRGVHSLLAGGSDANLYQMTGPNDNASPIIAKIKMPDGSDGRNFQHVRDAYIGLLTAQGPSLVINLESAGTDVVVALPNTNGLYQKIYQVLPALKGKIFSWCITNEFETNPAPFSFFREDISIRSKEWGDSGPYKPINPFADFSKRSRIQAGV